MVRCKGEPPVLREVEPAIWQRTIIPRAFKIENSQTFFLSGSFCYAEF